MVLFLPWTSTHILQVVHLLKHFFLYEMAKQIQWLLLQNCRILLLLRAKLIVTEKIPSADH